MALLDNLYLDSPIYGPGKHEIIVSRRVDLAHEKSEDAVEEHVDARYEAAGVDLDGHSVKDLMAPGSGDHTASLSRPRSVSTT